MEAVSLPPVKYLLPLLALALLLSACSSTPPRRVHWQSPEDEYSPTYVASRSGETQTESRAGRRKVWRSGESVHEISTANATRRNLYSPSTGSGPYTRELQEESWKYPIKTADEEMAQRREQQEIQAMQAVPKAKQ